KENLSGVSLKRIKHGLICALFKELYIGINIDNCRSNQEKFLDKMRKLLFGLIMVSIGITSCVKDEFNVDEEIAIIGTEWKGKGKLNVDSDSVELSLNFLKDGILHAAYDTTKWEGTYNFNLEANEGIIIDTADR